MSDLTIEQAKAQAKSLRAGLAQQGRAISHAEALELVAKQQGARDWNTLSARLSKPGATPFALHQIVQGQYLGQPFRGKLVAISDAGAGCFRVAIDLDVAIDTVRFDSFSNMRRHLRGVIGSDGVSMAKTSDHHPQLIVAPALSNA